MNLDIKSSLFETDPRHSDMVDAYAYMVASHEAKLLNDYVLMHIKECPWWLPNLIYRSILKRILVLDRFKLSHPTHNQMSNVNDKTV